MRKIWMVGCIVMFIFCLLSLALYDWLAVLRGWCASSFFASALLLWLRPENEEETEEPPEGGSEE